MADLTAAAPARHGAGAMRRAALAWVIATGLAGCAALQIDVDVYKGPLANGEDVERDQVIAMAMSSKTLLYAMRNNLLDRFEAANQGSAWANDPQMRVRVLQRNEFPCQKGFRKHNVSLFRTPWDDSTSSESENESDRKSEKECGKEYSKRRLTIAIQLNDILTHYENKGDARYRPALDRLQRAQRAYSDATEKYLKPEDGEEQANLQGSKAYQEAHVRRVPVWQALIDLIASGDRLEEDGDRGNQDSELRRLAADGISQATQVKLLACAIKLAEEKRLSQVTEWAHFAQESSATTEGGNANLSLEGKLEWSPARIDAARNGVRHALVMKTTEGVIALREAQSLFSRTPRSDIQQTCGAMEASAGLDREPVSRLEYYQIGRFRAEKINRANEMPPDGYRHTGIVESPPRPQANPQDKVEDRNFQEIVTALGALRATGFDNGRIDDGIDKLANEYAAKRDKAMRHRSTSNAVEQARATREEDAAFLRLERTLIDLAGRIQFLSTNLWLLSEETDDKGEAKLHRRASIHVPAVALSDADEGEFVTYKTLLESIANNIIVHGDDLRRKRKHDAGLARFAEAERRAVVNTFSSGPASEFSRIQEMLRARLQQAKDREDAVAPGSELSEARIRRDQLKGQRDKAIQTEAEIREMERDRAFLAVTLTEHFGKPSGAVHANGERYSELEAAAKRIRSAASAPDGKLTLDALAVRIQAALTAENKGNTSSTFKGGAAEIRLVAALRALTALNPIAPEGSEGDVASQWKAFLQLLESRVQDVLAQKLTSASATVSSLQASLKKADGEVSDLEQAALAKAAAAGETPSSEFELALETVSAQRDRTLALVTASGGEISQQLVMANLITAVDEAGTAPSPDGKPADVTKVLAILRELPVSSRISVSRADSSVDVQDEVIAQLRYAVIQAVQQYGKEHDVSRHALEALRVARKAREDSAYLRPASTYLRSVYSSTIAQNDPGLEYKNMLFSNLTLIRKWEESKATSEAAARARVELDKTYWQNINSVKLSAGGDSNFVIAKDDVGNWYVKAMASDPDAMVKAAKNLALYNLSGSFDSDLLRANELRERLDALPADSDLRAGLQSELSDLTGSGGAAGIKTRSKSLQLFEAHYAELTKDQLAELAGTVSGDTLQQAILQRWDTSLADVAGKADLKAVFQQAAVTSALSTARLAVQPPVNKGEAGDGVSPPPAAAGSAPPAAAEEKPEAVRRKANAIIQTLGALRKYQSALRSAVIANEALTGSAQAEATRAQADLAEAKRLLDKQKAKHEAIGSESPPQPGVGVGPNPPNAALLKELADSRAELQVRREAVETAESKAKSAETKLELAQLRRTHAAADVDAVLDTVIDAMVARRKQLVGETESAIKIVGRMVD